MHDLTTTLRTHKGEWLEVRPAEVCALLDAQDAEIAALKAERDRLREALRDVVSAWSGVECPACHFDCASANPPIALCPIRALTAACTALSPKKEG